MDINYLFLILALIAEILGTVGGFGSSVFFVPIGNLYFDYHSVLGLTALFHLSSNISKILLFKSGLDKRLLISIGIPSVVFVILGGILSRYINSLLLELFLGLFLILISSFFLIKKNYKIKANSANAVTGGILSGFSAGLLGTGGAIRGLTMAAFNLEKDIFIATSAFIDFVIDFSRTFVYYRNGYMHKHDMIYIPFLVLIGITGTYLGKKILTKIPQEKFRIISLILIFAIGLFSLINLW
ncbi:MAG: sulfite exporter TauE/SafE family protein [Flavobacteriales bacterium]|nr:sulfite exporter TauE/SafE family protein [Flavobacteriales bacterium]